MRAEKTSWVERALVARNVLVLSALGAVAGCVPGEVGGETGDACGSRGLEACAEGTFCNFPESAACGEADAPGTCTETPQFCTKEYAPVCGCDGNTYATACTAASQGVSVRTQGECATKPDAGAGQACGGLLGLQCSDPSQFCAYPAGSQCGAADQTGICSDKPEACITLYDPVCGCDGKTYGNACSAASAGVSVLSDGEC